MHRWRHAARFGGLVALGSSWAHAMDEPPKAGIASAPPSAAAKQQRFVTGVDFKQLTTETGEHGECPVWEPAPQVVRYSSTPRKDVERVDIDAVPGAFMLSNLLSTDECTSLAGLAETMGFVVLNRPHSVLTAIDRGELPASFASRSC